MNVLPAYVCMYVCMCVPMCVWCLWRPAEGTRVSGMAVMDGLLAAL